ncbi:uncharacterized protein VK521_003554 [Ammospiza maritima maritima]
MAKMHHHVMSYQKMQEALLYLLMEPAVVGNHWKAAVWSPTGQVIETAEAEGAVFVKTVTSCIASYKPGSSRILRISVHRLCMSKQCLHRRDSSSDTNFCNRKAHRNQELTGL